MNDNDLIDVYKNYNSSQEKYVSRIIHDITKMKDFLHAIKEIINTKQINNALIYTPINEYYKNIEYKFRHIRVVAFKDFEGENLTSDISLLLHKYSLKIKN